MTGTYVHGYDERENARLRDQAGTLVELLHGDTAYPAGGTVLEAGCGVGAQTVTLATRSPQARFTSVDVAAASVAEAERRVRRAGLGNVELRQADVFDLPFGPATFDHVFVCFLLEHLPRPVEALRRLAALAAADGRLVVEVPIAENGAGNDISPFFSPYHTTHFTRDGLRRALHAAGWSIADWEEQQDYNGCRVVAAIGDGPEPPLPEGDPAAYGRCLAAWHASAAHAEAVLATVDAPRCLVWGAGSHTEMLYHATSFFQTAPEREYRLVDRDPAKFGGTWRGIPIVAPDAVDGAQVPLVVSSYQGQPEIAAEALARGVDQIVALYDAIQVH
jgi:SAM-dependent methyltransferase